MKALNQWKVALRRVFRKGDLVVGDPTNEEDVKTPPTRAYETTEEALYVFIEHMAGPFDAVWADRAIAGARFRRQRFQTIVGANESRRSQDEIDFMIRRNLTSMAIGLDYVLSTSLSENTAVHAMMGISGVMQQMTLDMYCCSTHVLMHVQHGLMYTEYMADAEHGQLHESVTPPDRTQDFLYFQYNALLHHRLKHDGIYGPMGVKPGTYDIDELMAKRAGKSQLLPAFEQLMARYVEHAKPNATPEAEELFSRVEVEFHAMPNQSVEDAAIQREIGMVVNRILVNIGEINAEMTAGDMGESDGEKQNARTFKMRIPSAEPDRRLFHSLVEIDDATPPRES